MLFRHVVSLSGNNVRLVSSHNGTLSGITRDKGRRLEATRQYTVNGVLVSVAVVYANLKSNSVNIGVGFDLRTNTQTCTATYGGTGIRAF